MTILPISSETTAAGARIARSQPWLWIGLVLLALCALPMVLPSYQLSIATEILIFSVLAMSIDVLAGFGGRTSLGHGAIFGISAYVAIYWSASLDGNIWIGLLLGVLAATALAAAFALLAIRTSGVYFLLLTLALGMIVWGVCLRWTGVTGGENGLRGIGRPAFIAGHASFYYAVLAVVAPVTWVMWRFVHSPFGLTLAWHPRIRKPHAQSRLQCAAASVHRLCRVGILCGYRGCALRAVQRFRQSLDRAIVAIRRRAC